MPFIRSLGATKGVRGRFSKEIADLLAWVRSFCVSALPATFEQCGGVEGESTRRQHGALPARRPILVEEATSNDTKAFGWPDWAWPRSPRLTVARRHAWVRSFC
jgi:hypothetical protein